MERYDYRDAICEDIRIWIEHEADEFKADHADEKGRWLREDNKDEIFEEKVKNTLLDDRLNSYISPLINYDTENSEEYEEVPADNKFTVKALYRLSFHWRVTESEYLSRFIDGLKTLGFFDVYP